ncbi:Uncharacterised protein [Candidatus Tiddalikarchaeum anstoanum]|nr:Uncharacterised protein [Candidatus Tiddalikarchaeum anstoanum]
MNSLLNNNIIAQFLSTYFKIEGSNTSSYLKESFKKNIFEPYFRKIGVNMESLIKELPLESENIEAIMIKSSVMEEMKKEFAYPVERIGFLYGKYYTDKKQLRIYDLVNAEELKNLFGKEILHMEKEGCQVIDDLYEVRLTLAREAGKKGKGLVGVYHTHKSELGHTKGANTKDCLQKEFIGMMGFVLYYDSQLHVFPYRSIDGFYRTDEDIEKHYKEAEKIIKEF